MVIGIGGISRSGKSLIAGKIQDILSGRKVQIICQDKYIPKEENIPVIRDEIDWECPESLDFVRFREAILQASKNKDVVIAEGLMAFYDKSIENLYDFKIFVEITEKVFRERKKTDLRWGAFPDWYTDHIWDSYLKYGKIERGRADFLYLDGNTAPDEKLLQTFLLKNL